MADEQTITNIHLIDANRQSSEEYKGGDDSVPASWTNVVSGGLKLNAGDKVSVSYSCVNEVGCGNGQIETKGKLLDSSYTYLNGDIDGDLTTSPNGNWEYGPYANYKTTYTNKDVEKTPRDNEFNVELTYYKNTNGENYIHLPRRYDSKIDVAKPCEADWVGITDGEGPVGWEFGLKVNGKVWTQGDGVTNGRPHKNPIIRCFDDWHWYMGMKRYIPYSHVREGGMAWLTEGHLDLTEGNEITSCSTFWDTNMWKQKNDNSRYTIFMSERQYWEYDGMTTDDKTEWEDYFAIRDPACQIYHRYTELKEYEVKKGFNDPNNVAYQLTSQFSDPILGPQPMLLQQKSFDDTADTGLDVRVVPDYPCPFSMRSEGETYKPFPASNYATLSRGSVVGDAGYSADKGFGNYATYYNGATLDGQAGSTTAIKDHKRRDIIRYQSSFNCIGVKRPEFFQKGREMCVGIFGDVEDPVTCSEKEISQESWGGSLGYGGMDVLPWWRLKAGTPYKYNYRWMRTTIQWSESLAGSVDKRFKLISAWLKTQKLYAELLDFAKRDTDTTLTHETTLHKMDTPPLPNDLLTLEQDSEAVRPIKNAFAKRFFHVNPQDEDQDTAGRFGDDMSGTTFTTGHTGAEAWKNNSISSMPLFFYYDEGMEDTYVDNYDPNFDFTSTSFEDDAKEGHLCYGFAKKWLDPADGLYYVAINTRGTSVEQMNYGGDTGEGGFNYWTGNYIGYDCHFNAYGNSAIVLYTGILPNNKDGTQLVGQNTQGIDTATGWESNGGPTQSLYRNGTLIQPMGFSISRIIRQIYLGAIDPIVQFVSANSRFTFGGLHTPELIQNGNNAGKPLKAEEGEATDNVPVEADAGTDVYKINKRFTMWNNYTPEILPWREDITFNAPYWKAGTILNRPQDDPLGLTATHSIIVGQIRGHLDPIEDPVPDSDPPETYPNGYLITNMENSTFNPYPAEGSKVGENNFQDDALKGKSDIKPISEGQAREIDEQHPYEESNNNMSPFIVYDAHTGIFLEDFKIDNKRDWDRSLFGLMGLSWEQMNPDKQDNVVQVNRQAKLTRVNYNQVKPLTTCALVPQKDLPTYIKNLWQKTMYSHQMPTTTIASLWYGMIGDYWHKGTSSADIETDWATNGVGRRYFHLGDVNMPQVYPQVVNPQTSHSIMCDGLPIKMTSPYYLIKSDITSDSYYLKDKTPLPIVAIINKENLFGDFAFSQQSQLEYTITQQKTITSIRTEIYDPDMSYANVGVNSGVIYKIIKTIPINPNLIEELLTPKGESKKNTYDLNKDILPT